MLNPLVYNERESMGLQWVIYIATLCLGGIIKGPLCSDAYLQATYQNLESYVENIIY